MKVILASPKSNVTGGIARWTGHILNHYSSLESKEGIELIHFDNARSKQVSDNDLIRIFQALTDIPGIIKSFKKFIKEHPADVLHFTSSASLGLLRDLVTIKVAKRRGIKTIIHFRFGRTPDLVKSNGWEWILMRKVLKRVDKAIFIDKNSYDSVKKEGFCNIELLPNPIAPSVNAILTKIGEQKRDPNKILYVGHCTRKKGIVELVEACENMPNLDVVFIGNVIDGLDEWVASKTETNKSIHFVGEKPYEDIIKAMSTCTVFVLPSYTEGFPNVILEAMACGCAIVSTTVGAIPEMLEEDEKGRYGLIVAPQNVEELRAAIEMMLSDEILREECQKNVKERVNSRYSMPMVWSRMTQIWRSVLC